MYYIIALCIVLLAAAVFIYGAGNKKKESGSWDIPVININRDALEKSADEIQNFKCCSGSIYINRKAVMKSLNKSYEKIVHGYEFTANEAESRKDIMSCARWLLDNFYMIDKEYRDIKASMPEAYYKNLPVIKSGIYKGMPRIYLIAAEIIKHSDGKVDEKTIEIYINACQRNTILTIGELWAVPIMIRIALIENISRVVQGIVFAQKEIKSGELAADKIVDAIYDNKLEEAINEIRILRGMDYNSHFVSSFLKSLRDNSVENQTVYQWIDKELERKNTNADSIINLEYQKQASCEILMGSCITGIRETANMNWRVNFEKFSVVESILKEDPLGLYSSMDFQSRDYYRHSVEKIAEKTRLSEAYIARMSIQCAKEAVENNSQNDYERHAGYYLVDEGIKVLTAKLNLSRPLDNLVKRNLVPIYLGSVSTTTLLLAFFLCILNYSSYPGHSVWEFILAFIAVLIPCSEVVIPAFNWSLNYLVTPRFIPKIEFKDGIPEYCSTVIAVPALLEDAERIKQLISDMEVHYMANRERNLYFVLLSDFMDSDQESCLEDQEYIAVALKEIGRLNEKYCRPGEEIFYFLNRRRIYNEKQNRFMGWERKRGKLMEFNKLLRGEHNTSFTTISSSLVKVMGVKYVITLDSDTRLPLNTARRLIGAMHHVLNRPVVDSCKGRVIRGHGLLQPRIGISTESAGRTLFSRVFSGDAGIDIYSTSVSDVYEDLFDEGIYTGKGIYDLDVFMEVLKDKIPENLVLSHDLLEGSYTRAGLVTDVEFIDDYPAYYNSFSRRLHRWVRGDWQIISWIFKKSQLNILSRWKIIDNLRRSLVAPAEFFLITLAIILLPGEGEWMLVAFASIISPILFDVSEGVVFRSKNSSRMDKLMGTAAIFEKVFLVFVFLPYKAYLMADAVIRTLYRLNVSKRNLLEWQTAENAENQCGKDMADYLKSMSFSMAAGVLLFLSALSRGYNTAFVMLPYCGIWTVAPFIAYMVSKEVNITNHAINSEQQRNIRRIARKTWAYFEDFITEEDNWLAPDNYQEFPPNGLAHRTSPTNLGMGIISNISAYDLGFIGIKELSERLESTLEVMERLPKFRGHFLNWYDTKTLEPLIPRYISTVDSGNLAGYLMVASQSLKEYSCGELINGNVPSGVLDLLILSQQEVEEELAIKECYLEEIRDFENFQFEINSFRDKAASIIQKQDFIIQDRKHMYWNSKLKKFLLRIIDELKVNEDIIQKNNIMVKIDELRCKLENMANSMDFTLLYDENRQLFSIGYEMDKGCLSNCYYDLLASESRQASFIAIAKGQVDPGHWFKLGRTMAVYGGAKGLVSWSGTMFEYFMPLIIMKGYTHTLLDESCRAAVREQMNYSKGKSKFWGISESAFYKFDMGMNYQYRAFGAPNTALKSGAGDELVLSPYSTLLAMMINLKDSLSNIEIMIREGMEGRYGFYEAADCTSSRIGKGKEKAVIKSYMVHHQGMSLLSIENVLLSNVLQERFHSIPEIKAAELLLQERVPSTAVYRKSSIYEPVAGIKENCRIIPRTNNKLPAGMPRVNLISNGEYSIMVTNRGGGYSKYGDLLINRWKEDVSFDSYGMFFYIKNLNSGDYWSNAFEPSRTVPDKYETAFSEGKARFERTDGSITTSTEIIVSQEDNAELRKVTLVNHGDAARDIEITSYFEVTIAKLEADMAHPGFSNLFIKTEHVETPDCIIASRRPRSKSEKQNWIMHSLTLEGEKTGSLSWETSRQDFIGRGRNLQSPWAMEDEAPLKNTQGEVLDPIFSLRVRVRIEKGKSCTMYFSTGISDSREGVIELACKYKDLHNISRAFDLSWTHSTLELKYLGIKSPMANLFQDLASYIIYINRTLKDREALIKNGASGQPALWCFGISGDIPIVTVAAEGSEQLDHVRQMLLAHEYLSKKGLKLDLVILNKEEASYIQNFQDSLKELVDSGYARDKQNKPGGIFILNSTSLKAEDINLIKAVSRFVLDCREGSLLWKMKNIEIPETNYEKLEIRHLDFSFKWYSFGTYKLNYFNGFGGFHSKNSSYVIILKNFENTPAPWINVITNGKFGFQVSESGISYTWNKNSRENKLTSWSNDPVRDSESEALLLRDEQTGLKWGISPKPFRDNGEYIIEHGFGYSSFRHLANGIASEMTMFVPLNERIKIIKVTLKNLSDIERSLSLTYYARLVLGVAAEKTSQYIFSKYVDSQGYIYAENTFSQYFNNEKCYLKIEGGVDTTYTGDRSEFIGNGTPDEPEAMNNIRFSNNSGAGYDPCLAGNCKIKLGIGEERELVILLGQESDKTEIEKLILIYSSIKNINQGLEEVKKYWSGLTETIQVSTPDKSMDLMLNGWLVYQTLACRIWARTAFYQSGGAYGFRDQLQDTMALSYIDPSITREHILYSASRQFTEGDVQHWWHPVIESGIRTRFSDDLLWLPYVVEDYIKNTGDYSILDETAPYLADKPLNSGEDERYSISGKSKEVGTIYQHCIGALNKALKYGRHELPLMGSGDWNDGFSSIGNQGEGESIWLGWFLYKILDEFLSLCERMGDHESACKYTAEKNFLVFNLEKNGWDGDWYRRAYFDDGTPLGSIQNDECKIDSIAQSWAVISGGAKESRTKLCMEAVEKHLIKEDKGLIALFSPPFDKTNLEPGYIKGYLPGVRENGGQYTHGAVWVVIAMAKMGNGNRAWQLFNMLNQINHTRTYLECQIYKTEPYVIAADVYTAAPHMGRGGWSWYTGAAGWMYRAGIEWILGLKILGKEGFSIEPCVPDSWDNFSMNYRKGECLYHINVIRDSKKGIYINNKIIKSGIVPFYKNGEYEVKVII